MDVKIDKQHIRHLPPLKTFIGKVVLNMLIGVGLFTFSLGIGVWGYAHFEKMDWVDAYENAAMILSGMGPADPLKTVEGKIFAGTYAIFSGTIFLVVIAIVMAPIFHRFFHRYLAKILQD